MDKARAVALIIVGLLLIGTGAWFYKVVAQKYTPPGWGTPATCSGHIYAVSPAYKGAVGKGSIYYIFENGSIRKAGFTWHVYVLNDPCKANGTASVVLRFEPSGLVLQRQVPVTLLYRVFIAPIDAVAIAGKPSAAVTGLGVASAYQVSLQPRIIPGQVPNTYYYDFTSYYYDQNGMLVRIDSERILGAGAAPNAPQYMRLIDQVQDFYSSNGQGGGYVSYSRSLDIITSASIVAGIYIVAGLLLITLGTIKLIS
ncbi:MAG: hypothetical protein F7C33_01700 [Desulfurococcales archaeon]|nr:hypothetical protein [Desulfurococcales archaeon]